MTLQPRRLVDIAPDLLPDAHPDAGLFPPLRTDRLILRPLRAEDAEALHRLINDWAVVRMLETLPFPYPRELADDWVASTRRQLADGSATHLAIVDAQDRLLGCIGLKPDRAGREPGRDAGREAGLGYWIGRQHWGTGLATEAASRMARWALANLDIDRLTAACAADNLASAAVLRRIGFRQVGEGMDRFLARGGEHPVLRFEATRDDLFGAVEPAPPPAAPMPEAGTRLLLVVACALVDIDGRVLLARRPEGKTMAGLWEFPGGKLNPGETPEAALIRELREELGIDVAEACLAPFAFASYAYERAHLLMPLFVCRRWTGRPEGREGQALAWVRPDKLADYPMPPADKPLIPLLRELL